VVAPSAYLVEWMRAEGWDVPANTIVVPYLPAWLAMGEAPPQTEGPDGKPERIVFFGRIEERKGLRPFAAGVNELEPALLRNVELVFLGAATSAWPRDRVLGLLSDTTKDALRSISFESELDQPDAVAFLTHSRALAVMPSFGETFSNAVYECLQHGIPFIASDAGAPRELVAAEDHGTILFEPTAEGIARALRKALTRSLRAARLAFDPRDAYRRWDELVQREPRRRAERQSDGEFLLRLHEGDEPDDGMLERLTAAQVASGADVVTCGVRFPSGASRLFVGECGGLGALTNAYGTVGLVRRDLLARAPEADWLLYAQLALRGIKIVSVPEVLATVGREPADDPATALAVAQEFERALPREARSLARLAAGLEAQARQPTGAARRRLATLLRR